MRNQIIHWCHMTAARQGCHGPSRPIVDWTRNTTTSFAAIKNQPYPPVVQTTVAIEAGPGPKQPGDVAGVISCWHDPRENQLYNRQLHSMGVMTPVAEGWTRDTTTCSAATKTSRNTQLSRPQLPLEAGPGPKQPGAMDTIDPWWVDTRPWIDSASPLTLIL
jgi:hypothetical protein